MNRLPRVLADLQASQTALSVLASLAGQQPPGDPIVEVNLEAVERRRRDLERELLGLLQSQQIDLIRYEISCGAGGPCSAAGVARSIWCFQELLTSVFDAVRSPGAAHDPLVSAELSALFIASPDHGSVAVSMSVPNERLLLIEGDLDVSVRILFELLQVQTTHALRRVAKYVGPESTVALHDWAENSVRRGFDVVIRWRRADRERMLGVTLNDALLLKTTIETTHDDSAEAFELDVQLTNFNGSAGTFLVETADGKQIAGRLAEEFPHGSRPFLNGHYRANLTRAVRRSYARAERVYVWILHGLEAMD